jgi:Aspartyl protease
MQRAAIVVLAGLAYLSTAVVTRSASSLPVKLPLVADGLLVSLHATINGQPVQLDLDTGGTHTIIDTGTARRSGLKSLGPASVSGGGKGQVGASILRRFDIRFGTTTFVPEAPLAIDYSKVGRPGHLDGLVGFDFFSNYVVAIDCDDKTVTLYDPSTFVYSGHGAKVPLTFKGPRMYVPVIARVAGAPPEHQVLRLDIGSEDELDDDIVLKSTGPKKPISSGVGIGSRFQAYIGTVDELDIGPYTLHNLTAATGGVPIVGNAVLRKFNVVIDVRHATLYLEPRY